MFYHLWALSVGLLATPGVGVLPQDCLKAVCCSWKWGTVLGGCVLPSLGSLCWVAHFSWIQVCASVLKDVLHHLTVVCLELGSSRGGYGPPSHYKMLVVSTGGVLGAARPAD